MIKIKQTSQSKKLNRFIALAIILFFVFTHRFTHLVAAQGIFDLTISPPSAYLNLLPGTQSSHIITLTNNSDRELTVIPRLVDSKPENYSSIPQLSNELNFPYLSQEKTKLDKLTIPPSGTGVLKLFFNVPINAINHEYSITALFASEYSKQLQTENGTSSSLVTGAIGSNLVIYVGNQNNRSLIQVKNMNMPKLIDSFRPIIVNPIITNLGQHASIASGSAEIKDWKNNLVQQSTIFPKVILSNQELYLSFLPEYTKHSELPQPTVLTYKRMFLLGPYSVTIKLNDQNGTTYFTQTEKIYALPISIVLTICTIILFIYLFKRFAKNYWEHKLD